MSILGNHSTIVSKEEIFFDYDPLIKIYTTRTDTGQCFGYYKTYNKSKTYIEGFQLNNNDEGEIIANFKYL